MSSRLPSAGQIPRLVRRLVRWYLTPSGLLLACALVIAAMAIVMKWPWPGLGAVALMAIFLPYRLSRQQGVAEDRLMAEVARLQKRHNVSDANTATALSTQSEERDEALSAQRAELGTQHAELEQGLTELKEVVRRLRLQIDSMAAQRSDFTKMRLMVRDRLPDHVASLDDVGALSQEVSGLSSQVVELAQHIGVVEQLANRTAVNSAESG